MADPLSAVQPGNVSPFVTSVATNNVALDILRRARESFRGPEGGVNKPLEDLPPALRVLVRNDSGAALDEYSVVKLGDPIQDVTDDDEVHDFRRTPTFVGTIPDDATNTVAILIEPVDYPGGGDYRFARAVIQGVVPCDIDITDTAHGYATPTPSDATQLTSAATGPARILYVESGTGTKRAVVLVGGLELSAGSSPTASCSSFGWAAGLTTTDCLRLTVISVSGDCSGINTTQKVYLKWDGGATRWVQTYNFVHDGGDSSVQFWLDGGQLHLTISTTEGLLECGGDGYAIFAFGGSTLCAGSPANCANYFRVKVECYCCPFDDYDGPGWYCVQDIDTSCTVVVEIVGDGDECSDVVYCSGPFTTELEADAHCTTPTPETGGEACDTGTDISLSTWYEITVTSAAQQVLRYKPIADGNYRCRAVLMSNTATNWSGGFFRGSDADECFAFNGACITNLGPGQHDLDCTDSLAEGGVAAGAEILFSMLVFSAGNVVYRFRVDPA